VGLVTVVVGLAGGVLIGRLDGHFGAIFLVACFFGLLLGMIGSPRRPVAQPNGAAAPTSVARRPGIGRAGLRRRVLSR
jgi:hypothetical protein